MTPTLILTPRDRRSAAFFWLGVGIFPMFWSWFTLSKRFAGWQRMLAFLWLAVIAKVVWLTWPERADQYSLLVTEYPSFWLLLTFALFGWLFVRMTNTNPFFALLFFIMSGNLGNGILMSLEAVSYHLSIGVAILLPLVPAMLHITVEPLHEALGCQEKKSSK